MALTPRPSHKEQLNFPGLTNMQILLLALRATEPLGWKIEEVTLQRAQINVPMGMQSYGEKMTLTLEGNDNGEMTIRSQSISVQWIDYGKNRKNIRKLREAMEELKASLTPEELEQMAKNLETSINTPLTEEEETLQREQEKQESFLSFFIPRKGFLATPILIDINILVFIIMIANGVALLEPTTLALLKWGADFAPLTLTGDWWRTITCNFVHIGAIHLIMNVYAFMYIGLWLERLIGTQRMFVAYLLTGFCSAIVSLSTHGETISTGASGSIFGLYGIFLAYLLFKRVDKSQQKPLLTSILLFIGFNLVYGMKDGIDNAAHLGGLISGFTLGLIYIGSTKLDKAKLQKICPTIGSLCLLSVFLVVFLVQCKNIPSSYQDTRKEWDVVKSYSDEEFQQELQRQQELQKRQEMIQQIFQDIHQTTSPYIEPIQ